MTEKNILAYFKSAEEADKAKERLKPVHVVDMKLSQFSAFPGEGVDTPMNPITGNFASLAELTLGADISNKGAGILTSTDVSASGMSDGGEGDSTMGYNYLLTVVVEDAAFDQARQIIESCGGRM